MAPELQLYANYVKLNRTRFFTTNVELWTLSGAKLILEKHGNVATKSKMEITLNELSLLPILLVLPAFLTVRVDPSLEKYAVFRVESMNVLSLVASRLLKNCLINMLSDEKEAANILCEINSDSKTIN